MLGWSSMDSARRLNRGQGVEGRIFGLPLASADASVRCLGIISERCGTSDRVCPMSFTLS